jgi:hypothetical protein
MPYWKELLFLCETLGLGLFTVTFLKTGAFVTEHVHAQRNGLRIQKKRQAQLLQETIARRGDFNIGGTNKTKRLTAYRQLALLCADEISKHGPRSPKQLRESLYNNKVSALLQANVYQWFRRESRGIYGLTAEGQNALIEYADPLRAIRSFEYNEGNSNL